MNTTPTNDMHHILVAHVVNNLACSSNGKHDFVECELTKFLSLLNKLLKDYQNYFNLENKTEMIGSDNLRSIIQGGNLRDIINIHEDLVKIDLSPQKFQSTLSTVLVDTAIRYSEVLKKEVNELTKAYHNVDESIPTKQNEASEPVVVEPVSDHVEVSEPVDMEVDETRSTEQGTQPPVEQELPTISTTKPLEEDETKVSHESEEGDEVEMAEAPKDDVKEDVDEEMGSDNEADSAMQTSDLTSIQAEETEELGPEKDVSEESRNLPSEGTLEVKQDSRLSEPESALTPISQEGEISETASPVPDNLIVASTEELEPSRAGPLQELGIDETNRERSESPMVASQKHKRFQNIAINLIKTIEEHRFSSPFLTPVNAKEYEDVIRDPKDLKSILKAVRQKDAQVYGTVKELERDIMLMFANCVMYNKSNTHLVEMAKQMKDDVKKTFKMFEDAELDIK